MKPLQVSNNQLAAVAKCDLMTVLRYVHNREAKGGDGGPTLLGSVVHEAIKVRWGGGTVKEALRELRPYRTWAEEHVDPDDRFQARLAWDNVRRSVRYYLENNDPEHLPFVVNPDRLEVPFAVALTKSGDIELIGIIDSGPNRDKKSRKFYPVDHKAQPLWCKILTPDGWKEMGEIKPGDYVIGKNGRPTRVLEVLPQGELEMYQIDTSDDCRTFCSADHVWTVTDQYGKERTMTLRELLALPDYLRFRLPINDSVRFAPLDEELPLSSYLLGALLGDGYLNGNSISFSTAEEEMLELVENELPGDVYLHKAGIENYSWNIVARDRSVGNSVLHAIQDLGLHGSLSHTHKIPELYMRATVGCRLSLLQGLLDTDGCAHKNHVYFDSVSSKLADQVVELVRSLGGIAWKRQRSGTNRQAYRVTLWLPALLPPFRLERKQRKVVRRNPTRRIESITNVGCKHEMQCIRVEAEDGLYITDGYIVTHNSTSAIDAPWFLERFRMDSQITGYLWAVRQLTTEPVVGMYINAVQISKLPDIVRNKNGSFRKCREHEVGIDECHHKHQKSQLIFIDRNEEAMKAWRWDALDLARKFVALRDEYSDLDDLEKVPQQGKFNGACGFCDFKEFCFIGRPVDRLLPMTAEREARSEWA